MFDWLVAEAYHKLRSEIMYLVELHSKEYKEHDSYQSGKLFAFADVLNCMIAVDHELHEKIMNEVEKEVQYYLSERSADESRSDQT